MKLSTLVCFGLFLIGVVLWLVELWLHTWNSETFFKLMATDGSVFAVSVVWVFLVKENKESEKIHKGNSLD